MKQYLISEKDLRNLIAESFIAEIFMETDPDLETIKRAVCEKEGMSWDDIIDDILQRCFAGQEVK
jgi:hypothetical protein